LFTIVAAFGVAQDDVIAILKGRFFNGTSNFGKKGIGAVRRISPIVNVMPRLSERARALGRYPSSFITARTRSRTSSETKRVLLITWETVVGDTCAFSATSRMVGMRTSFTDLSLHRRFNRFWVLRNGLRNPLRNRLRNLILPIFALLVKYFACSSLK
jgi:hypothetical protein